MTVKNEPFEIVLGRVGVAWPNRDKIIWLWLEIMRSDFGFVVSLREGETESGIKFWSLAFLLGILRFRISRDK